MRRLELTGMPEELAEELRVLYRYGGERTRNALRDGARRYAEYGLDDAPEGLWTLRRWMERARREKAERDARNAEADQRWDEEVARLRSHYPTLALLTRERDRVQRELSAYNARLRKRGERGGDLVGDPPQQTLSRRYHLLCEAVELAEVSGKTG